MAPADGIVLGLIVHTIGGVVGPGEPILTIVPQSAELLISAQVNVMDIDRVHKGQMAHIRFSSFSSQTTPIIEGRLVDLSADAVSSDKNTPAFYQAKVEVTELGASMLGGLTLVPGMPVEVLINTGSRTMFQYLTQPIRNAFARALIED
jgi:epimerase transport system membrane fusion protein